MLSSRVPFTSPVDPIRVHRKGSRGQKAGEGLGRVTLVPSEGGWAREAGHGQRGLLRRGQGRDCADRGAVLLSASPRAPFSRVSLEYVCTCLLTPLADNRVLDVTT